MDLDMVEHPNGIAVLLHYPAPIFGGAFQPTPNSPTTYYTPYLSMAFVFQVSRRGRSFSHFPTVPNNTIVTESDFASNAM